MMKHSITLTLCRIRLYKGRRRGLWQWSILCTVVLGNAAGFRDRGEEKGLTEQDNTRGSEDWGASGGKEQNNGVKRGGAQETKEPVFIVDETYAAAGLSLTMKSELVWARRTQINRNSPTYEQIVTVLYTSYQILFY